MRPDPLRSLIAAPVAGVGCVVATVELYGRQIHDSSQTAALVTSALDMAIRDCSARPGVVIH